MNAGVFRESPVDSSWVSLTCHCAPLLVKNYDALQAAANSRPVIGQHYRGLSFPFEGCWCLLTSLCRVLHIHTLPTPYGWHRGAVSWTCGASESSACAQTVVQGRVRKVIRR